MAKGNRNPVQVVNIADVAPKKGGPSPNPLGRPKKNELVDEILTDLVPQAIFVLQQAITQTEDMKLALDASREILNRKFGKPKVMVDSNNRHIVAIKILGDEDLSEEDMFG